MATVQNKQTITNTTTNTVSNVASKVKANNAATSAGTLFTKENHKWITIGGVLMVLGFIIMAGGKSNDANAFNTNEVYSFIRITLAPVLILAGLGTLVYAIMKKG